MGEQGEASYTIELCQGELTPEREQKLAAYLLTERAFTDSEEAALRASQTAALVMDDGGNIVAHVSADPRYVEQLDNRFWVVAIYVSPAARHSAMSRELFRRVRDYLEARFLAGRNPDTIGIFVVAQTRAYRSRRNEAVTPAGLVFVGRNRHGDNMRVYYFEGARIDGAPPDTAQRDPAGLEPGVGYRLEVVRDRHDEDLTARVAHFLQTEGALKDREQARRLAAQTVVLAYDAAGNIAALHAAEAHYFRQLINQFWAISVYVGAAPRRAHLARHLNLAGQRYLEEQFLAGRDPQVIGLYLRLRSPPTSDADQRGVSDYSKMVFVGRNRLGDDFRIYYFPGARIDRDQRDVNGEN